MGMFMGKEWPTLTELFFGKGNGPQGKMVDTGKYPNGMTAKKPPANAKSKVKPTKADKARGTRKDFTAQQKLKKLK